MQHVSKRNIGIDTLRGLSILSVILLHLNIHFSFTTTFLKDILPKQLFSLFFWSGFYGVVVFFTLSGYLITNSILMKWGKPTDIHLKTFYWSRFSRIIPLLLTLLVLLSILHLANVQGFVIDSKQTSIIRAFFAALTFHINWLEIQVGYLPASWDILWSISIEETFYLVFPMVCLFLEKEWHFVFILALFMIVSPWARINLYPGNELADKNHLAYIDSLALGCMAAIAAARITFPKLLNVIFLLAGCTMVTLVVYFRSVVYQSGLVDLGLNVSILSIGVALVLLWLHDKQRSGNEKDYLIFRWLRYMGIYSYEIYLTHMFVVIGGATAYRYFEPGAGYLIPFALLIIVISYVLGYFVFNYFSEPINLWLRRRNSKD